MYRLIVCFVVSVTIASSTSEKRVDITTWSSSVADTLTTDRPWVNTCGRAYQLTDHLANKGNRKRMRVTRNTPNKYVILRSFLINSLLRLNDTKMHAINVTEINQWFKFNSSYAFLPVVNLTVKQTFRNLKKRHIQMQTYIGAFEFLSRNQESIDRKLGQGADKSIELNALMILAKNLLCEIEQTIEVTGTKKPGIIKRKRMEHILKFRSNNTSDENISINELDIIFAKVRFHEYVHDFLKVVKRAIRRRKAGQKLNRIKKIRH